jgi:hypothetical protein
MRSIRGHHRCTRTRLRAGEPEFLNQGRGTKPHAYLADTDKARDSLRRYAAAIWREEERPGGSTKDGRASNLPNFVAFSLSRAGATKNS